MKKLPIGIQTFKTIINDGYLYIDKTKQALQLIDSGKYYFLSRPRRFGKSLFLDTLKNIFQGNKELFNGLYIEDKYDWTQKYPVINISFGSGIIHSRKELDKRIIDILKDNQVKLNIECEDITDVARCFNTFIIKAHNKYNKKVVILIDEYDKPILDNITNVKISNEIIDGLKNFYSVIKDSDEFVQFAFLTGVSKFSKVSLFSGLNNLEDITIDRRYSDLCGYTHKDLEISFKEYLKGVDMQELKLWYNGYNWSGEKVYNPFDILLFISKEHQFRNYWFETGTPTFLIELMKDKNYFLPQLENLKVNEKLIGSFDVSNLQVETLLFQTGYLTIKESFTKHRGLEFILSYPNKEVRISLNDYLIDYFTEQVTEKFIYQDNIYEALEQNDFVKLEEIFISIFASIPYNNFIKNKMYEYEGYYASVIYSYLASAGFELTAEDVTNKGRIDLTIKFPNNEKIFILEFKVIEDNKSSVKALKQIKQKEYALKYKAKVKDIYLIGIDFSKEKRNIENFEWEKEK